MNLERTMIDEVWPKTQKWHISDTNLSPIYHHSPIYHQSITNHQFFWNPGPHYGSTLVVHYRWSRQNGAGSSRCYSLALIDWLSRLFIPIFSSGRIIFSFLLKFSPAVLVLDVEQLFIHLLHAHASTEDGRHGEVAPVTWITGRHHVLRVEHLLRQLRHGQRAVLLRATRRQRREARHEKVQPREGDHVHGQFAEIRVELAREAETRGHAGHGRRHQVVQVAVRSEWSASACGSKCRREPRCRCRRSRRCSPPAGARTVWRCTAPPPYQTPKNVK